MSNSVIQIAGLVLCVIAGICTILAVILPEWRRNDPKGEVIEAVIRHQGIWLRCISYSTGLWQCDDFDAFFLGLPQQLQVARGLSMVAIFGMFFGVLLSIVGMDCTTCMTNSKKIKSRIALVGSGFWIMSAIAIGSAVSYYANQVVEDYTFSSNLLVAINGDQSNRYVFGSSLFLGWAAMAIGALGGGIMMCGSCYVESDEDEYWNRGPVGRGVRRMRSSFRESYRAFRPKPKSSPERREVDYV